MLKSITYFAVLGLGHDDFCAPSSKCEDGKGDCDRDNECQNGLVCGTDNCQGNEYEPSDDCCMPGTRIMRGQPESQRIFRLLVYVDESLSSNVGSYIKNKQM